MTRSTAKIRAWSFCLAAVLLLFGFLLDARLRLREETSLLEYTYRRALNDMADRVSHMEPLLEKAAYAGGSATLSDISAELLEETQGALAAMGALPFSQEQAAPIGRFLSQAGDYSLSLSRSAARGKAPDQQDGETLFRLSQYAGKLSQALGKAQARLTADGLQVGAAKSALSNLEELPVLSPINGELEAAAQELSDFPSLLYDGPFSDHISQLEPQFLKGKPTVSQEEARQIAAALLDASSEDLIFGGEGKIDGTGENGISVYSFFQGDSHVNVTKSGGEIAYYKRSGQFLEKKLSPEEAVKAAGETLRAQGITAFRESYFVLNDNMCTINFQAVSQDGQEVTLYPDLIKVSVELGEGKTVEYDAGGYLMNHRDRSIPAPKLTREKAMAKISPRLRPDSSSLALIPTPGGGETLCWEFLCTAGNGRQVLSYINADTGLEEQLFLLQTDDHGTLVL